MNNVGEGKIAIKMANAVTMVLQKNENGISVSDVSYKNNAITQEDPKAASLVTINQEASANATTQGKSVDEVNRTVENETQSVNLEKSTEVYKSTSKMLQTSRRHKKPPVTRTDDFLR
jgi:hypothetical protein